MKRCNCGEMMTGENTLDYPKIYSCPLCGGTLSVSEKGIQQWFDNKGNPATYAPPTKSKKVKGEES